MATPARTNSPSSNSARNDKSKNKSKVVVLALAPKHLLKFPHEVIKAESSSNSPPEADEGDMPAVKVSEATDNNSDSNSTPAPGQDSSQGTDRKRKGPAPGKKRNSEQVNDLLKPRGKPGPKKKPRLEEGAAESGSKPNAGPTGISSHKLGPRANQGAINAGLRALDRSGAPCRKWARKEFHVKSFTGVMWQVPSWKGGEKSSVNGDDLTDAKDSSMQSSSDIQAPASDTAKDSNASDQIFTMNMSPPSILPTAPAGPAIAAAG